MKDNKPGWQKDEPIDRVYIKYNSNNNLPTHEAILHNKRYKEVNSLASDVCVTNEANQNVTTSKK